MASVLDRLDEVFAKFTKYMKENSSYVGITPEDYAIRAQKLPRDVILALPLIEKAIETHREALHTYIDARKAGEERPDITYFLKLAPKDVSFDPAKIPVSVIDKAVQFGRAFESLLKDLDKEDE